MWGYEAYPCEGLVAFEYILAMVRHPEVYRKLQDEIDQVVGQGRLPEFGDRETLPYAECVIKEMYR